MKGRQLVSIRLRKSKAHSMYENSLGFVQGVSEEIQVISPKERKIHNQMYLKSISPDPLRQKATGSLNSSVTDYMQNHSDIKRATFASNFSSITHRKEKIFRLDPNSQFSVHFHEKEEKELAKLHHELFPKEIIEDIEYLPDYTPTRLIKHLKLDPSRKHYSQDSHAEPNTISNIVKSPLKMRKIDLEKLKSSQFTTYSTGWGGFCNRTPMRTPRKYHVNLQNFLPAISKTNSM